MKATIINLAGFKLAWAAAVFSAAAGQPAIGLGVMLAAVLLHLARARDAQAEALVIVVAAFVGLLWESSLVRAGLLTYPSGAWLPGFAPYWIVGMWMLFATTLNVGMRWLRSRPMLPLLAGAIGGPLAFVAGERAGAVEFGDPTLSPVVIGVGWAILLPVLVRLAARLDGYAAEPAGSPWTPLAGEGDAR